MIFRCWVLLLSLAAMGCGKSADSKAAENNVVRSAPPQPEAYPSQQVAKPATLGNHSRGPVDAESAARARAVLGSYAELVGQKRWADAGRLWTERSDTAAPLAELKQFERLEMIVGDPGPTEGAAGSIYIDIPLRLTGTTKSGEALSLAGTATLRRVNDVPGSSEVERSWHIYRLDLQPRP